jgi:hypothetical protein
MKTTLPDWMVSCFDESTSSRRLRSLYRDDPSALNRTARRLRGLLRASQLASTGGCGSLFVILPCRAFDEIYAFRSLAELLECEKGIVPILLVPDRESCELAWRNAARDDLSGLVYVLAADHVWNQAALAAASPSGAVMVLLHDGPLGAQVTTEVSRQRERRLFVCSWQAAGHAGGDVACVMFRDVPLDVVDLAMARCEHAAMHSAGHGALTSSPTGQLGVIRTLRSSGDVIAVSHEWPETLLDCERPSSLTARVHCRTDQLAFDLDSGALIGVLSPSSDALVKALDASAITCYANRGGAGNDLIFGFALGHGCRVAYAEDYFDEEVPGTPLVWGVLRNSDKVVAAAVAAGRPYIYCDHAYFHRGHLRNYRVIVNGHATTALRRCPEDRSARLGVELKPWRKGGRHVLVCPPTDFFLKAHGCPNWLENTLSTLRQVTDRPVRVRAKPVPGAAGPSLEEDLAECHALVTHSSNIAVEAAVLGVPVYVEPSCAAVAVGLTDLRRIESPWRPDHRKLWLANLAYCQFSFDEVLGGQVLSTIRQYIEMEQFA